MSEITNAHRVLAYQMISPEDRNMSDFIMQLPSRPRWQTIVNLIASGNLVEAQRKARIINGEESIDIEAAVVALGEAGGDWTEASYALGYAEGTWTRERLQNHAFSSANICLECCEAHYSIQIDRVKRHTTDTFPQSYLDGWIAASRESLTKLQQEDEEQEESMPRADDFADLHSLLKGLDEEDRKKVWINTDEGIVRVFFGKKMIFSADEVHFVHAFFINYQIDIDENIPTR